MSYFRQLLQHNREFIIKEVLEVKGLMHLLMKYKDTEGHWTKEEKREIKLHLKNISKVVPVMTIFLLPGGSFLLPFLVDILEKREG
jgi:hypothetical protein